MKNTLFFSIIAAALLFHATCFGEPRIDFNETSHNFGAVRAGSTLKHIFRFRNTGSSTLKIEKVETG